MAVGQMEKVTQRNAANAEQSAASSEELASQARCLYESVDRLRRLTGEARRDAATTPPVAAGTALLREAPVTKAVSEIDAFPLDDQESWMNGGN
jgi:methyl-accepting chemotaxis protein